MEFNLPWCEAGPPNRLDDKVDSDQWVVNKELSLFQGLGFGGQDPRVRGASESNSKTPTPPRTTIGP